MIPLCLIARSVSSRRKRNILRMLGSISIDSLQNSIQKPFVLKRLAWARADTR
jgi:hypothetical protein